MWILEAAKFSVIFKVDQLEKALNDSPGIKMNILLDCLRGTRGGDEDSSASLLKR